MPMMMTTPSYNPMMVGNPAGFYPGSTDPSQYQNPYITPSWTAPQLPDGPASPQYNPVWNPSMSLTPGMDQELSGINTQPLDQSVQNFADLADRQGPSAWATMAGQQQDALASNQMEKGAAQTNAGTAAAMSQLGESGGITSGARERAAEGGNTNLMNMTQNVGRQNSLNQMQIGVNDQQNKMQEMGMLPGMESSALQPQFQKANMWENAQNTDVQNAMNNNTAANNWNMNLYNTQMQAAGDQAQANATQNSGSSIWNQIGDAMPWNW
jgi:hypothetical protein